MIPMNQTSNNGMSLVGLEDPSSPSVGVTTLEVTSLGQIAVTLIWAEVFYTKRGEMEGLYRLQVVVGYLLGEGRNIL